MKISKRYRWIILMIVVLGVFSVSFLFWNNPVSAAFSNIHAFTVMLRVETEIMQKSPAGQYYESLFWKHNDELMRIMNAYPENNAEFWRVTRLFIPELEALLDGDGDKVYITSDDVESLEIELDWLASVGNPALRADIQKEKERFSLEKFVGMSMNEALDFINSNWSPDSVVEKNLVPDSDGSWAYYKYHDVYLEYPVTYTLQVSGLDQNYIYFFPSTGIPEYWNPCVMKVRIWNIPPTEKESNNPYYWYSSESIVWQDIVQTQQFQGLEFISSRKDINDMDIHAYQYNEENQLAVDIWVFVFKPLEGETVEYSQMINQQYGYFQHMVDNLRIEKP